jgi:hypothetical protein
MKWRNSLGALDVKPGDARLQSAKRECRTHGAAAAQRCRSNARDTHHVVHDKQWQVRYDFDAPIARIGFPRSPDDARAQTWIPDQGVWGRGNAVSHRPLLRVRGAMR